MARLFYYGAPLVLDAGAAALVLGGRSLGGAALPLLAAATLHLLAAALAYASAARELGSGSAGASARRSAALACAALVLALPVVGSAVLAFVSWPSWSQRVQSADAAQVEVALPDGSEAVDDAALESAPGARPIHELLRDAESPDDRVRAVMALRQMDARSAVPLLRLAFTHPSEDVRLLAFGILEQREKRLRARIQANERRLASAGADAATRPARWHRRLARDHWELVYGGFVSGDLEPAVLAQARDHAQAALGHEPDAKMAVLLARIYLRRRQPEPAQAYLEQARRAGLPAASAAPLLAEAAFQRRRFDEIAPILRGVQRAELRRPELEPVAEYWAGEP